MANGDRRIIGVIAGGAVLGGTEVVIVVSFATLLFPRGQAGGAAGGTPLLLAGALLVMIATAARSSIPGAFGSAQDIPAAVLAVVAAGVTAAAAPEDGFASVVALLVTATVTTGLALLVMGWFRVGTMVRFVPFPVVRGFLASTGWLLAVGGVATLASVEVDVLRPAEVLRDGALGPLAAGLAIAVALVVVDRRSRASAALPMTLAVTAAVTHAGLWVAGLDSVTARADGWLLPTAERGAGSLLTAVQVLPDADWSAVLGQWPGIAAVVLLTPLALLLNVSGIEVETGMDADLDGEVRTAGAANVLAGFVGGIPGFHALSFTTLARRMGGATRATGFAAAGVVGLALLAGPSVVSLLPTPVVGGLLLYLGLDFLDTWLVRDARRVPAVDTAVVVLMLLVVATVGFLPAVVVGLLAAIALFVVSYARGQVVRTPVSGAVYRSRVDRPVEHRDVLRSAGERVQVIELTGYVFFGTANRVLEQVRHLVTTVPDLRHVVIDVHRVAGVDSSAAFVVQRIQQRLRAAGTDLLVSGATPDVLQRLTTTADEPPRTFTDVDHALEWCEDALLAEAGVALESLSAQDAVALEIAVGAEAAARVRTVMREVDAPAGSLLVRAGDEADDLYVLVDGRLTVRVGVEEDGTRLRSLRPGSVVGEVGLLLDTPRTASVRAETDCRLLHMTRADLVALERDDPGAAAAVHRSLARLLASRLRDSLAMVEALVD